MSGDNRGFTLIEVLVAMTIVGVGVVTLLEVFSTGLRLGSKSSLRTDSMAISRQLMDEVLSRQDLNQGANAGRLPTGGRWQMEVIPVRDDAPNLDLSNAWELKEVTLNVTVDDGGRETPVALKTYRLEKKTR